MQQASLSQAPSFAGSWASLNLTKWINDAIHDSFHFTGLTPVQASLIPLAINKNKDLLVEAVTGSGKTMAYVVPILERLIRREQELKDERGGEKGLRKNEVFAIVVAPTRELAVQIHAVFEQFFDALNKAMAPADDEETPKEDGVIEGDDTGNGDEIATRTVYYPSPLLLISGTSSTKILTPSPIIVATPGRLSSYLSSSTALRSSAATSTIPSFAKNRHQVSLSQFGVLVLDEADQLLSSRDHLKDMKTIWGCLPRQRRNWLFSATMMDIMGEKASQAGTEGTNMNVLLGGESGLEQAGLRNLTRVVVRVQQKSGGAVKRKRENDDADGSSGKERRIPVGLKTGYLVCKQSEKMLQLVRILRREATMDGRSKFIVYLSTCAAVEYFYRVLTKLPELSAFRFFSLHGQLPTPVRSKTLQSFTENVATPAHPAVLLCTDVAARGLDLPEVDVVVQHDPPTDPKMFSHRAGRTARMGRAGTAVVLLAQGREESYVEFLRLRKIPLTRLPYIKADLSEQDGVLDPSVAESSATGPRGGNVDPDALALLHDMQDIVLTDRELTDKAAKAFVSSVRAYSKHEASYIFPLKSLDLFGMGRSYGLLRLPRMPEVSEWKARFLKRQERSARKGMATLDDEDEAEDTGDGLGWTDRDVNWDTYAYASKPREADRLAALVKASEMSEEATARRAEAAKRKELREQQQTPWSKKLDKKERREERRGKREKKKDWEARVAKERAERGESPEDVGADKKTAVEVEDDGADDYRSMLAEEAEHRKAEDDAVTAGGGFDDLE